MNRHLINYMVQDSWLGLKRNPLSTFASVFLMALALLLLGALLSARLFAGDAIDYIESQLSMKVYVSETLQVEEVAAILKEKAYVEKAVIESGDDNLEKLSFFFNGKEHLLEAFNDGVMLDAVKLQISDKTEMDRIAGELQTINGIEQVVYPQQMAAALDSWITNLERWGIAAVIVFMAIAFLMVYLCFHLALYKREAELTVKLFVGMDPKAVRAQFVLEGLLLSLFGAIIAVLLTAGFQLAILKPLQKALPFSGELGSYDLGIVLALQFMAAFLIGGAASFLSTRKLIADG